MNKQLLYLVQSFPYSSFFSDTLTVDIYINSFTRPPLMLILYPMEFTSLHMMILTDVLVTTVTCQSRIHGFPLSIHLSIYLSIKYSNFLGYQECRYQKRTQDIYR